MPQAKAPLFLQDNNFRFPNRNHHHHHHTTNSSSATPNSTNNNDKHPRQPLGQAFDLSSLEAELPPNTGPPGTVAVTNGSSSNANKNLSHVPCKFFKQGNCQAGDSCPFSHEIDGALAADRLPCKYFLRGNCKFGMKCALAHYLPDGTIVNSKAIMGNSGNGYQSHSHGTKQLKYGQATNYNMNQASSNGNSNTSQEYAYSRLHRPEEGFTTTRSRYTSTSPPDVHPAGAATVSNGGYYSNYHTNQQQPSTQSSSIQQTAFYELGQSYPQQQQQQQLLQLYALPRQFSRQEEPISFNSLTDDSLARFTKHTQQEQSSPPLKYEHVNWSPIEQYANPIEYQPQWAPQHRRVSSQNQPHSLGSNSFATTFNDGTVLNNAPSIQLLHFGVRRSYSTGGQIPTTRTTVSPPQLSTTTGINIQSSTPSATTPTSRFSFSSGGSTAISQANDFALPVKPNNSQYLYQNISLASPVFDDDEGDQQSNSLQYNTFARQDISNAVFEEDFLPGSLADVILTPQELKRRDSRSQSGTLNNRPSLRGLLEATGYTEVEEEEDNGLEAKPRATPNEDVFLME